jgi:hypothetical protein
VGLRTRLALPGNAGKTVALKFCDADSGSTHSLVRLSLLIRGHSHNSGYAKTSSGSISGNDLPRHEPRRDRQDDIFLDDVDRRNSSRSSRRRQKTGWSIHADLPTQRKTRRRNSPSRPRLRKEATLTVKQIAARDCLGTPQTGGGQKLTSLHAIQPLPSDARVSDFSDNRNLKEKLNATARTDLWFDPNNEQRTMWFYWLVAGLTL